MAFVCAWRVRNDDMKQPGFRRAHSRHHTLTSPQQQAHLRRCPSLSFLNLLAVPGYGRRSSRGLAKSRIISAFLLLGFSASLISLPLMIPLYTAAAKPSHFYPITHPHRRALRQKQAVDLHSQALPTTVAATTPEGPQQLSRLQR